MVRAEEGVEFVDVAKLVGLSTREHEEPLTKRADPDIAGVAFNNAANIGGAFFPEMKYFELITVFGR